MVDHACETCKKNVPDEEIGKALVFVDETDIGKALIFEEEMGIGKAL